MSGCLYLAQLGSERYSIMYRSIKNQQLEAQEGETVSLCKPLLVSGQPRAQTAKGASSKLC